MHPVKLKTVLGLSLKRGSGVVVKSDCNHTEGVEKILVLSAHVVRAELGAAGDGAIRGLRVFNRGRFGRHDRDGGRDQRNGPI